MAKHTTTRSPRKYEVHWRDGDEETRQVNAYLHDFGQRLDEKCETCGFWLYFDGHCPNCEGCDES